MSLQTDSTPPAPAVTGTVRKLLQTESDRFRDHLLRLDRDSRHQRFAHGVSDQFITDYAARMNDMGGIVWAHIVDGEVRAAAELRRLSDTWGHEAEAAFSVEKPYQNHGIGGDLMGRVIRAARNRGVRLVYMICLADNARMQAIARKHEADLKFEVGEVVGEIVPEGPSYFSLLGEAVEDRVAYMLAVLDLQSRLSKAA
jgi:GNAT superfamily N-acetyltransferase